MLQYLFALFLLGTVPIFPGAPAPGSQPEPAPRPAQEPASFVGPLQDDGGSFLTLADLPNESLVLVHSIHQTGVGFLFLDPRHVVTSYRLIAHGRALTVETRAGRRIGASVLAWDKGDDLAILRLREEVGDGKPLQPFPAGETAVGQVGVAIGYPSRPGQRLDTLEQAIRDRALSVGRITGQDPRYVTLDRELEPYRLAGPILDANGRLLGISTQLRGARASSPAKPGQAVCAARLESLIQSIPLGEPGRPSVGGFSTAAGAGLGTAFGQGPTAWSLDLFFALIWNDRWEGSVRAGIASRKLDGGGFPERGSTFSWVPITLEGGYHFYLGELLGGLSFAHLGLGATWVQRTTETMGYVLSADSAGVEVLREGSRKSIDQAFLPQLSASWLWSIYELRYAFTPDPGGGDLTRHSLALLVRWGAP